MNIRYILRDSSFVKFLVGGVILITLAGSGLYLVKQNQPTKVAMTDKNKAIEAEKSGDSTDTNTEETKTLPSDFSQKSSSNVSSDETVRQGSTVTATDQISSLPTGGTTDTVSTALILGCITYLFGIMLGKKTARS